MKRATLAVLAGLLATTATFAEEFAGPYFGEVVRVIDGDNFEAKIEIWPTISSTVSVRIAGIDAPELFRPQCPQEALGARAAKEALRELIPPKTEVRLEHVEADSFSGRVLAVVYRQKLERGRTLTELLLNRDVVELWTPGDPDIDWCATTD